MKNLSNTQLKEFLIGLQDDLLLLGSWEKELEPTAVNLTHCEKYHLSKIARQRINLILDDPSFKDDGEF